MKHALILLWMTAAALLTGCSPTVKSLEGKQVDLKHYGFTARYADTDSTILLTCGGRTKDNEGCQRGASIYFPKLNKSCYGNWWLKKQGEEWQVVIEWQKDREFLPHCIRLPDSDIFKAAEFR